MDKVEESLMVIDLSQITIFSQEICKEDMS